MKKTIHSNPNMKKLSNQGMTQMTFPIIEIAGVIIDILCLENEMTDVENEMMEDHIVCWLCPF